MKVLITGISGFAGTHLASYLSSLNRYEIFGISLTGKSSKNVKIYNGDLLEKKRIEEIVKEVKPDYIYHLAALSSPKKSFGEPDRTIVNNIDSELNLLESVRKLDQNPRILIVSSADIYGIVDEKKLPINEETSLNPLNPYSVSKVGQDLLALSFYRSFGLNIIRVRPFNHTGPGQTELFVIPAFCKRIIEAKKAGKESIKVGNLKAKRDFTDVRDIVKAYVLAIEKGKPGDVYNLGSGMSYSMEEVLDKLIKLSGSGLEKEQDPSLMLPIDNPNLVCDCSKFTELTSWRSEIPFDKTLQDTLDYWKQAV